MSMSNQKQSSARKPKQGRVIAAGEARNFMKTGWHLPAAVTGLLAVVALLYVTRPSQPVLAQASASGPALDVPSMERRLDSYPVFYHFDTPHVRAIFERGQGLGIRPNVFTVVGDSNTTNGDFLRPLGLHPNDCDLGDYSALQETVDFFSASPREGEDNSFVNRSVAAAMGFSTALVLDPAWAEWRLCEPNESPLQCEYRLVRPSVAIIMLGQVDINEGHLTVDEYRANMDEIVRTSIDAGVIPVLTTIVFLPYKETYSLSLQYDMALLDLADTYQVPLLNLWPMAQRLPNYGIGPDNSHLSTRVGSFCKFNGPEKQFGNVLRNLLSLQALDTLRLTLLDNRAATPESTKDTP